MSSSPPPRLSTTGCLVPGDLLVSSVLAWLRLRLLQICQRTPSLTRACRISYIAPRFYTSPWNLFIWDKATAPLSSLSARPLKETIIFLDNTDSVSVEDNPEDFVCVSSSGPAGESDNEPEHWDTTSRLLSVDTLCRFIVMSHFCWLLQRTACLFGYNFSIKHLSKVSTNSIIIGLYISYQKL